MGPPDAICAHGQASPSFLREPIHMAHNLQHRVSQPHQPGTPGTPPGAIQCYSLAITSWVVSASGSEAALRGGKKTKKQRKDLESEYPALCGMSPWKGEYCSY